MSRDKPELNVINMHVLINCADSEGEFTTKIIRADVKLSLPFVLHSNLVHCKEKATNTMVQNLISEQLRQSARALKNRPIQTFSESF